MINLLKKITFLLNKYLIIFKNIDVISPSSIIKDILNFIKRVIFDKKSLIINENLTESLLESYFLEGLLSLIETVNNKYDIIELGTYKAGTTIYIAKLLQKLNLEKKIYGCDTFSGHPYDDKFGKDKKGRFSDTNVNYIIQKFKLFKIKENTIILIIGKFEETLNFKLKNCLFSFAFIDCDLLQSAKVCLDFLDERMTINSIIAFHDYANKRFGISKIVHEFCRRNNKKLYIHPIPHIRY